MARIIYSGLVTNIRGSVGGTTFQKNAFGYTVKNKSNMIRPNSLAQNAIKTIISRLSKRWAIMSVAQRLEWNNFASTFPQYSKHNPGSSLSGYQCFLKRNFYQLEAYGPTGAILYSPALVNYAFVSFELNITLVGNSLTCHILFESSVPTVSCSLYLFNSVSKTRLFIDTRTRYMANFDNASNTIPLSAAYLAAFGKLPTVGSEMWVKIVECSSFSGFVFAPYKTIVTIE